MRCSWASPQSGKTYTYMALKMFSNFALPKSSIPTLCGWWQACPIHQGVNAIIVQELQWKSWSRSIHCPAQNHLFQWLENLPVAQSCIKTTGLAMWIEPPIRPEMLSKPAQCAPREVLGITHTEEGFDLVVWRLGLFAVIYAVQLLFFYPIYLAWMYIVHHAFFPICYMFVYEINCANGKTQHLKSNEKLG